MNAVLTKQLWLQAFQKKQAEKFVLRGVPTRKEENWKYTSIPAAICHPEEHSDEGSPDSGKSFSIKNMAQDDNVIYFVNGHYSHGLTQLSDSIIVAPLSQALHAHEAMLKPYLLNEPDVQRFPFATLNNAHMTDGLFIHVPKNTVVTKPIHIIFYNTQQDNKRTNLRNIIIADESAELTIIEEYISDAKESFTNVVTEIHAASNARVHFYKIQDETLSTTHVSNIFVQQQKDSNVDIFTLSKGATLSREDVTVNLSADGAECRLLGLSMLYHDGQHVDHHILVNHMAGHGHSSMVYKGILDKKSRTVFNGKVHVHPNAKANIANQANHNLLLSREAEVNTKPELEIYSEDVKCTHGATIGQMDEESLFYLRSRGISRDSSVNLLLDAFADEVISQIQQSDVRKYIKNRVGSHVEL